MIVLQVDVKPPMVEYVDMASIVWLEQLELFECYCSTCCWYVVTDRMSLVCCVRLNAMNAIQHRDNAMRVQDAVRYAEDKE